MASDDEKSLDAGIIVVIVLLALAVAGMAGYILTGGVANRAGSGDGSSGSDDATPRAVLLSRARATGGGAENAFSNPMYADPSEGTAHPTCSTAPVQSTLVLSAEYPRVGT